MRPERSVEVLQAGYAAAYKKMSAKRCCSKKEITDFSFLELYVRLFMEIEELQREIFKLKYDYEKPVLPPEILEAIKAEAGDVIAFASGIVAKVNRTLEPPKDEKQMDLF